MTKQEAIEALDRLDRYWERKRTVRQHKGYMMPFWRSCDCFGAHVDRALQQRRERWTEMAQFLQGKRMYLAITLTLGIKRDDALDMLRPYAGRCSRYPFGSEEWQTHSNEGGSRLEAAGGIRE